MADVSAEGVSNRTVRVWPPLASRVLCLLLVIAGPLGVVTSVAVGWWFIAPIWAVLTLIGARFVGWVEIDDETIAHRRLIGESHSVPFSQIREVGLGMHQVRKTKLWYPEVETEDGRSFKFLMLKSASGSSTIARVQEIFDACMEQMPSQDEDAFTTVTTSADGELEFLLTPGYDAFRREQAEAGAEEVVAAEVEKPSESPVSERHLTLCEPAAPAVPESVDDSDVETQLEEEEEPEVFTPRPLTEDRRKSGSHLTLVHDLFVERAEDRRVPTDLPAVVIEQPEPSMRLVPPPIPASATETDRPFTSLFRRAS